MSWPEAQFIIDSIQVGIAPDNMKRFACQAGDRCVKITLTWPDDTKVENPETHAAQTISTVRGVKVVMKAGSDPIENENDGILLFDSTAKSQYSTTPYVVENLTNDQPYTFAAFPYSDQGTVNRNPLNQKTIVPKSYILLGFKIDKNDSNPATRVHYTEGAEGLTPAHVNLSTGAFDYGSFGDFWFVTENKPYMVRYDGTADYELDPNDYTRKKDGTASDVSNLSYDGNAMAKIPLVYLKQWEDSNYEYCNICNTQPDEDYKAYAHMRSDGSVMDYIWLSCFESCLSSSKARSIKGQSPMANQTGTNEITYSKANGSLWSTRSWSQRNLINMLLILMGKTTDTQKAFGKGYYNYGNSSAPNYLTSGGASDKGQFYGSNKTRDYVKVFHIENWWGDVWERIEGCVTNSSTHILIKDTPGYNTTGTGYTDTGIVPGGTSGGYISACVMTDHGLIPKTASGSETTHYPDVLWFAKDCYAFVGGASDHRLLVGALALALNSIVSVAGWHIGAALSCEQPITDA